jgi:hypothetical protein
MAALLLGGFASAHAAALTTPACLAKKLKAWGNLRRCQAIENGEALQGRESHLPACQTTFNNSLAKIDAQATAAAIACRYGVNGDGTVTDYDTGLQWEQKTADGSVHDRNNVYAWSASGTAPDGPAFTVFVGTLNNGTSPDSAPTTSGCFASHCDWRLPTVEDVFGNPYGFDLRNPIFGPPAGQGDEGYWLATTVTFDLGSAWCFGACTDDGFGKLDVLFVRAVRTAL